MGVVRSVNLGTARAVNGLTGRTGIDKRPVTGPVRVRAPGPAKGHSGVVGDEIVSTLHHGGNDQAVYAYATEDLAGWRAELGRDLPPGTFGENLTTDGLDLTGAVIGEQWAVGERLVLQVTSPRIPCATFAAWLDLPKWIRRFTERAAPGAYLRVIHPGPAQAGDPVVITHRPAHGVTIGTVFRALTLEPDLLPLLTGVPDLPDGKRDAVARRLAAQRVAARRLAARGQPPAANAAR
ncbi:MAG TPA: MOSC domain-containing protein [Pseudonocardiaceae bacterium]|nr:MOSC domain-containing protein [Pseudonocardiaceae bacterium]